jgi:predicted nucleic-acid-binding protein
MIAIDTNVLVRLLAQDDVAQSERARLKLMQAEDAGEPIRINDVVLAETLWTLTRRYKLPRQELQSVVRALLNAAAFDFERRTDIEHAVDLFEHSTADFSDCLIFAKNAAAGCRATLSFDKDCRSLPGARWLKTPS